MKIDPLTRPFGRPLTAKKGRRDYVLTVDVDSDAVERAIYPQYQRNLTSTRKYRTIGSERQWANGSYVFDPSETKYQHHAYLFSNEDETTDVYAHKEWSAEHHPYEHVTEQQAHGDPDNRITLLMDEANIEIIHRA